MDPKKEFTFKKIEIEKSDMGVTVRCDDVWADCLGYDEALFTVAAILNGRAPRYLKTTEMNAAWNHKYRGPILLLKESNK